MIDYKILIKIIKTRINSGLNPFYKSDNDYIYTLSLIRINNIDNCITIDVKYICLINAYIIKLDLTSSLYKMFSSVVNRMLLNTQLSTIYNA